MNKKGQQRLYFLRKMVSLLKVFYNYFIERVLTFCITCWFGNATEEQKNSLRKVLNIVSKLLGTPMIGLEQIYQTRCLSKAMEITSMQPLYDEFELLPSGRRFRMPILLKIGEKNQTLFTTSSEMLK